MPDTDARPSTRPVLSGVVALVLAATLLVSGSADGAPPPATPAPGGAAAGGSHLVTLVTGDVVRVDRAADGTASARVVRRSGRSTWYQNFSDGGDLYVVPSAAMAAISADDLDLELFNVTALVEQGLDDEHSSTLPVIVTYSSTVSSSKGSSARTQTPTTAPAGSRTTARLGSIHGLAVAARKSSAARFWADLTDAPTHGEPRVAGDTVHPDVEKIWFDARTEATLDESVPLIGAPQVWARGFDGTGVRVGVLDTGIDATHPDFAGRIGDTQDFTGKGNVVDGSGHGTHVASIAAGSGAASDGRYRGVAPGAEIEVGKVLDDGGYGRLSWLIAGMQWAAPRSDVVNISLGGPMTRGDDPASLALDELTEQFGTLFVVAAGNQGWHDSQTHYVTSPGTAADALTVGATDQWGVANFSRNMVMGTSDLKPEIVAPGTDITAAQAAGTGDGSPYASHSGTSMATPHVAGSVALLTQQHPDWGPEQLKNALESTATPLDTAGSWFEGAGRVDVDRASRQTVHVDRGVLDLGWFTRPFTADEQVVSRTLTYRNDGDAEVTLDLTTTMETYLGDPVEPGHLTLDRDHLTLAPGATGQVTVTLDATTLEGNSYLPYAGAVVATTGDQQVHTTVGFIKEGDTVNVTFRALDRHGQPAYASLRVSQYKNFNNGGYYPDLLFFSPDQREWTIRLPENDYNVVSNIVTLDESGRFARDISVVGDPELEVAPPGFDVTLDARDARPVSLTTPQTSEPHSLGVTWTRGSDRRNRWRIEASWFPWADGSRERISIAPTAPVTAEPFQVMTSLEQGPPLVSARIESPTDPLQVVYSGGPLTSGTQRLPVVDVGTATGLDGADLAGKLALVRESPTVSWYEQVNAVAAAGGSAMLLASAEPGVFWPELGGAPVTVLSVPQDVGTRLARRVASGATTVRVTQTPAAPYAFEQTFVERTRVGTDLAYRSSDQPTATVERTLQEVAGADDRGAEWTHQTWSQACACATYPLYDGAAPGTSRTETVTADPDLAMQTALNISLWGAWRGFESPTRATYEPRTRVADRWLGAPLAPGLPNTAFRDGVASVRSPGGISYSVAALRDGAGHWTDDSYQLDTQTRFYRVGDPEPLVASPWLSQWVGVPEGPGDYRIEVDSDRDGPGLSTSTRTAWQFHSGDAGTWEEPAVLPLVDVLVSGLTHGREGDALDRANAAQADSDVVLHLQAGHQRGATAAAVERVGVEVSYDGGRTWAKADVAAGSAEGAFLARYAHPALGDTDGFVSLRVTARDGDGNTFEQTVLHAYALKES